jgi:hypothetical protein
MTPGSAELAPSSCTPLPLRSRHTKSPIRIGDAKPKSNVRLCEAGATLAPRIVTNVPLIASLSRLSATWSASVTCRPGRWSVSMMYCVLGCRPCWRRSNV